eukprot:3606146-Rhodomonas_salina.4
MRFGSARERIVLRSRCICSRNSGRSFSDGVSERRWSSDSSVTGRTIVKQSRSGKKCVSILRIRFFASICSVNPARSPAAFSLLLRSKARVRKSAGLTWRRLQRALEILLERI